MELPVTLKPPGKGEEQWATPHKAAETKLKAK